MVKRKQILSVFGLILIIVLGKSLKKQQDLTFLKSVLKEQEFNVDVKERAFHAQVYDNYTLHYYRESVEQHFI